MMRPPPFLSPLILNPFSPDVKTVVKYGRQEMEREVEERREGEGGGGGTDMWTEMPSISRGAKSSGKGSVVQRK